MTGSQYEALKSGFPYLELLWLISGLMAVSAAMGIAIAHHLLVGAGLAGEGQIATALGPGLLSLIGFSLFVGSSWVVFSVVRSR